MQLSEHWKNQSQLFQTLERPGTQAVVAAISDVAGNVGTASNSIALSVVTNAQYLSDAAGCLTNIAYTGTDGFNSLVALEWDERYRLEEVQGSGFTVQYTYDVLNRRTSISDGIDTLYMISDGQQVVADVDENKNRLRSYVWGTGIDNLLAMTVYGDSTNTYYAIKNHQNSVLAFVDSNGAVAESYEYDAWGRTRVFGANGDELTESALGNRYCFQGREIDWTTGFYYFRARWYNPVSGRWLSKDPIGIGGGLNLYEAFGNNPVNMIDPLGQDVISGVEVEMSVVMPGSDNDTSTMGKSYVGNWNGEGMDTYIFHNTGTAAAVDFGASVNAVFAVGDGSWSGEFKNVYASAFGFTLSVFWSPGEGGWTGFSFGFAGGSPFGGGYKKTCYEE